MEESGRGNGAVLGVAGLVAGAVGAVVSLFMSRESEDESHDVLQKRLNQLDAASRTGKDTTMKSIRKVRKSLPKDYENTRQRLSAFGTQMTGMATTQADSARTRIQDGDLTGATQRLASTVKGKSQDSVSRAESAGAEVASRVSDVASEVRSQLPQLTSRASKAADDVKERGAHVAEQVRQKAPDIRDQLENKIAPLMKDLKHQAGPLLSDVAGAATATLEVANARAHEARTWAEKDALPELRQSLDDMSHRVAQKARAAESTLAGVSSEAAERFADVTDGMEDRSRKAATAAAKGTKDTGSLLFWTTIAGGVIYYSFLSQEQRAKVRAAGRRIGSEAREIYRDIQGTDREFS